MAEIDEIDEGDSDADWFPSVRPGELDIDQWLVNGVAGTARLTGRCVDIAAADIVAKARLSATESSFAPGTVMICSWAVYERETDGQTSADITATELADLRSNTPEPRAALSLLGLTAR